MKPKKLLTAPQVARLCGADLKTIHNWVNADLIACFRTPGRHLRFRLEDVAGFMDSYGYPWPAEHDRPERLVVLFIDPNDRSRRKTCQSLAEVFEVEDFACPVEALLAVGWVKPAAVAMDVELPGFDGCHLAERLAATEVVDPFPVVLYTDAGGDIDGLWKQTGASALVRKPGAARLRDTVGKLLAAKAPAPGRESTP